MHDQPGQPDGPQQPLGPPGPPWPQQVPVPPNSPPLSPGAPYPPPQYPPQPGPSAYQYGYPPPPTGPPPRKKHTGRRVLLYLAIALVVVIVIAQLTGGGDQNQPAAGGGTGDSGGASAQPAASGQGAQDPHRVVRDGDFAFRFLGMNCGSGAAARVYRDSITGSLPPGTTECLVRLRVTNGKGEAQTWFASNQTAIDARGHRLTADDNAVFLPAAHESTQLNPGVSLTALVPYNLPRGDRIVKLELHDSLFSGGVTVQLSSQS